MRHPTVNAPLWDSPLAAGPRRIQWKEVAMQLTVAVLGAPHGLKGEVRLDVRTDSPELRLAAGTALETDPAEAGPLTVARTREYKGATYARFDECGDRTTAEALRGVRLVVETDEDETAEEDAYYAHELVGLEALDPDGYILGEVSAVEHMPGHDILVVREPDGILARVPFVAQIVTEVDLGDGCIVVDAPPGLFSDEELAVSEETAQAPAASATGGRDSKDATEGQA